jgi:hypothetical protein
MNSCGVKSFRIKKLVPTSLNISDTLPISSELQTYTPFTCISPTHTPIYRPFSISRFQFQGSQGYTLLLGNLVLNIKNNNIPQPARSQPDCLWTESNLNKQQEHSSNQDKKHFLQKQG